MTWTVLGKFAAFTLFVALSLQAAAQTGGAYKVTNLISDGSVPATVTDPTFINPWAISDSGTWWMSSEGSGYNFVVSSTATPLGTVNFKVIIPQSGLTATAGHPTGSVTTAGTAGMILPNATKASFLFSTLDGTISGWNSKLGTANAICQIAIDNSAAGASYTGLTILNSATTSYILAANFGIGNAIEVYDSTFKPAKLTGTFTDPGLPAGYSPFSVHVINNQVYVAYAVRSATAPYHTIDALGNGVVDIFDANGNFVARAATKGNLDSPWGVAIAPANFGIFGGSLLIGNFANGLIHAYDPKTFDYRGELTDGTGKPLTYPSLWELLPGGTAVGNTTSVSGGDTNTIYFTAGLAGEAHGLFAALSNDTSSGTPSYGLSAATTALTVTNGSSVPTVISIAPTYNFNGIVKLACTGLPAGSTCTFLPAQITASATAPSTAILTIQTSKTMALLERTGHGVAGLAPALLLPFASVLVFYRRRFSALSGILGLFVLCGIMIAALGTVMGCGGGASTPAGTSQVSVTATSGSITQTMTIALTVQ
ncbi:MAG TPA: TIGR03118 family protein [Terracidiphilus sp.]|nr:TIGR03118 family protein [Terracidiphilus sp.]